MNKILKIFNKFFPIASPIIIIVGIVIDALIKFSVLNKYWIVSEHYILYVFSLIFTVSTLACTLLSIIVSVSNNRVLGLQIKEIVSLDGSPLKLKRMICVTLSIVMISIPLFALKCNTAITMLATCLIVYFIFNTIILCSIVFDNNFAKGIVLSEIQETKSIKPHYIHYWLTAVYNSIIENDIASEEEYLSLLKSAAEAEFDFFIQIGNHIQNLFFESCKRQSFLDSYKRIIKLNDTSKDFFDERRIVYNYIKSIKYASPTKLNDANLSGNIGAIVMCDFLSKDDKIYYCYIIFNSIINNENTDLIDKMEFLYNGLCSLLWLDNKHAFGDVRVKTAILLFKREVLLSKDFTIGIEVHKQIIKAIYKYNAERPSKPLFSLLAQMVRMIYFWSYLEVETLSAERRALISSLPKTTVDTIDNASLSFGFLVDRFHKGILDYLICDSITDDSDDPLDYMPEIINGKTVVCSNENKIKFALWFYFVWGYDFCVFPIDNCFKNYSEDNMLLIRSILISAHEEFDKGEKCLTKKAKERIEKFQRLFEKSSILPEQFIKESFDIINNKIDYINKMQIKEPDNSTISEIKSALTNSVKAYPEFTFDDSISLESATTIKLPQLLCSKTIDSDFISSIVYYVKSRITDYINTIIKERLHPIELTFDQSGVTRLKEELEKDNYLYRNYTFYDDWGIGQSARESQDYSELKKLIDLINWDNHSYLHDHVFLKVDCVKYNYSLENIEIKECDYETIEKYLSLCRVANEQYYIDGATYNKISAIEYFKKTKFVFNSRIKLETNVTSSSGFRVVFFNKKQKD
ncbi:MAG: hypothetical protein IJU45_04995 [Clostridia bacterium]|nr:hypothetical protein [Clostridia bacterium]